MIIYHYVTKAFFGTIMVQDHIPIVDNEFTLKKYETLSYLTQKSRHELDNDYYFHLYNVPGTYLNLHTNNVVDITVRKILNKFIISIDNTDQRIVVSYEAMLKLYVQYLLYNPLAIFKYGDVFSQDITDYEYLSDEYLSDDIDYL